MENSQRYCRIHYVQCSTVSEKSKSSTGETSCGSCESLLYADCPAYAKQSERSAVYRRRYDTGRNAMLKEMQRILRGRGGNPHRQSCLRRRTSAVCRPAVCRLLHASEPAEISCTNCLILCCKQRNSERNRTNFGAVPPVFLHIFGDFCITSVRLEPVNRLEIRIEPRQLRLRRRITDAGPAGGAELSRHRHHLRRDSRRLHRPRSEKRGQMRVKGHKISHHAINPCFPARDSAPRTPGTHHFVSVRRNSAPSSVTCTA